MAYIRAMEIRTEGHNVEWLSDLDAFSTLLTNRAELCHKHHCDSITPWNKLPFRRHATKAPHGVHRASEVMAGLPEYCLRMDPHGYPYIVRIPWEHRGDQPPGPRREPSRWTQYPCTSPLYIPTRRSNNNNAEALTTRRVQQHDDLELGTIRRSIKNRKGVEVHTYCMYVPQQVRDCLQATPVLRRSS